MSQIADAKAPRTFYLEATPRKGGGGRFLRFWLRRPAVVVALAIITMFVVVAVLAPVVATHDPIATDARARLEDPSSEHLFGTDPVGHDTFSGIIYGARVSLLVGILATLFGTIGGGLIGLLSGYFRGPLDDFIQRVMDALVAVPALILLLLVGTSVEGQEQYLPGWFEGRSIWTVILGLSIVIAPLAGRVMRGAVLSERESQYVEAARVVGAGHMRIMGLHILPNVMSVLIVISSITIGSAMLIEGALSFLGQGIQPDDPTWKTSWGAMLDPNNISYQEQQPWLAFFPGVALGLAVLAFNILGDFIRDVLDPRLRGLFEKPS